MLRGASKSVTDIIGNLIEREHISRAQDNHSFDDIFQFPYISRPAVSENKPHRRMGDRQILSRLLQEVLNEKRDVFAPFT